MSDSICQTPELSLQIPVLSFGNWRVDKREAPSYRKQEKRDISSQTSFLLLY